MKRFILLLLLVCISCMQVAEARRFGGGHSRGFSQHRSYSQSRSYSQPGVQHNAPRSGMSSGAKRALAAGAVGAAAGYVAGSALASNHQGESANTASKSSSGFGFIKFVVLALLLLMIYRFFVKRRMQGVTNSASDTLPDGTNIAAFISQSMNVFMQVQQLNTPDQLEVLKGYLTPNMYQSVCGDVGNNAEPAQFHQMQTDFDGCRKEGQYWVASVRFYGQVKEDGASPWSEFSEVWHFSKADNEYIWRVAGIQQV